MSIFVRDTIFLRAAIGTLLSAAAAQSPPPPDFCSSPAACYTPARGPNCPQVRFGWGDCPGSRQACDWCYGPNGVFAYTPRGSTYTLNSGCNQFGNNATWTTKDAQIAQWMSQAGGNCVSDGRGGYTCSNVDAGRFKQAANCGSTGTPPAPAQAPAQAPAPTPTASSGNNPGPCSNPAACYTPARGPNCPRVRFGWGDCPGSRQACDWCYGPDGGVFAYTPRGSVYTLESGCNQFGSNTTWATKDPLVAQSMSNAGGNCSSDGQGGYACSNVDAGRYKQAANCGGGCWTNLPEGKLCTQGKYFKDRNGRTVLLRGVNLAGTSKIPPFLALPKKGGVMGFVLNNGVMNTASFDFIGNSDFSELDPLPAWGLNVIRLLFVWEAYEPVQGTGSQRYLDYLSRIVDEAWSRGIYTIIDFHQDAYARFLAGGCGEGFPQWSIPPGITLDKPVNDASCANWMLKAFGFDYIRFWKDLTSGNWNDLFAGQFDPRVHSAFHDFYADTNGVRSHYRQVMANLASTFSGKKGAIGYDVLNEPFSDPLESELTSLYGDVANDIRQGDPYALLFLEPNLLTDTGKLTLVKPPSGVPGVVYAPHFYDPDVMVKKQFTSPLLTIAAYKTMVAQAASWNAPLFVGEFGGLAAASGVANYIDTIHKLSNDDILSWAQWSYTPGWTKDAKDGWNGEDLSIVDDQLNYRANLFHPRPQPQAINGEPQSLTVDVGNFSDTLELHWINNPGGALSSTQTVIYVPNYRVTITDSITPMADSGSPPVCRRDGTHRIVCESSAADARLGVRIRRYGSGGVVP